LTPAGWAGLALLAVCAVASLAVTVWSIQESAVPLELNVHLKTQWRIQEKELETARTRIQRFSSALAQQKDYERRADFLVRQTLNEAYT